MLTMLYADLIFGVFDRSEHWVSRLRCAFTFVAPNTMALSPILTASYSSPFVTYYRSCLTSDLSSSLSSTSLDSGVSSVDGDAKSSDFEVNPGHSPVDLGNGTSNLDITDVACKHGASVRGDFFMQSLRSILQTLEAESREKDLTMQQLAESLKALKQQLKVTWGSRNNGKEMCKFLLI